MAFEIVEVPGCTVSATCNWLNLCDTLPGRIVNVGCLETPTYGYRARPVGTVISEFDSTRRLVRYVTGAVMEDAECIQLIDPVAGVRSALSDDWRIHTLVQNACAVAVVIVDIAENAIRPRCVDQTIQIIVAEGLIGRPP